MFKIKYSILALNQPLDQTNNSQRPGTSVSFATEVPISEAEPMSIQHECSLDQHMTSLDQQDVIADITSELELSKINLYE